MRTPKAFIAGLGTTSVLVCSAMLLLVVGSAVVAFHGWPGLERRGEVDSVAVRPLDTGGPLLGTLAAQGRFPARRASAGSPRSHGERAPSSPERGVPPREATPLLPPVGLGGHDRARGGGESNPPAKPKPPRAEPVSPPTAAPRRRVVRRVADSTERLTGGLGDAVGQVSPTLGQTVKDTGRTLAQLLRGLRLRPSGQAPAR